MLPKKVGRYEVLGQLATGGMAEILLARLSGAGDFNRAVVIKRILPQYAKRPSFVAMFLDEARTIAKIRHPNVVQVHELGEEEGVLFLVLEFVAGENLSSVLKRSVAAEESLDAGLVAWIVAEACGGLHAAHELVTEDGKRQNLVHRDVSPQNLFVGYDGHVKLLDFGVAITEERMARTEAGDLKGKLEYMSPEHARGEPLDRRSDIFAMGIVLYELGTGRRLFKRTSPARTLSAICNEPIIPPSRLTKNFPKALEDVCMRALAKNPADRFATAAEMRLALLDVARDFASPVEALAERMQRWFPDRIAEKQELLRRVRAGDEVTHVPAGEVEEKVQVPGMPEEPRQTRPVRRKRIAAVAVVASGLIVGVAAAALRAPTRILRATEQQEAETEAAPSTVTTAISTSPGSDSNALTGDPASERGDKVIVHIESRPPGARVMADGREEGVTPLDIHVDRGDTPIRLELQKAGFSPTIQPIVPDADQKLLFSLRPSVRTRVGPLPTKPPPRTPPSGFRRF